MTYVRGRLAVLREKLKRLPRMLAILAVSVIVSAIGALIANAFGLIGLSFLLAPRRYSSQVGLSLGI